MAHFNADGLLHKYGTEEAAAGQAGELCVCGPLLEVVVRLDLVDDAPLASTILDDSNVILPANARIEEIEIVTHTAATSAGAATLNIGLIRLDRTTALDADGLVAALAITAYDAAGEKTVIRVGSTGAGALLGTTLANPGYLVIDAETAVFTAGVIHVRIKYYMVA